jgi:hypothetical protein
MNANRYAAHLFTKHAQPNKAQEATQRAHEAAAELNKTHVALTLPQLVGYYIGVGDLSTALTLAKKDSELRHNDAGDLQYLQLLCMTGQFEEAQRVVAVQTKRGEAPDPVSLFNRALVWAESGEQGRVEAAKLYAESKLRQHDGSEALYPQLVLRLLGQPTEATQECRRLHERSANWIKWRDGWYLKILDYQRGAIDAAELLRDAGKSNYSVCEANFFIGLTELANGHKSNAQECFKNAVATGIYNFREYQWSQLFLARMKADPEWPTWIETKPTPPK